MSELSESMDRELRRIERAGMPGVNANLLDHRSVEALVRRGLVSYDGNRGTYVVTAEGAARTHTASGDWAGVRAITRPPAIVIPETSVLAHPANLKLAPKPTLAELDEQRWHTWRRGGIGGSDIPPLLGYRGSPWEVWADKMGMLPGREVNEQMEIGKALEPFLIGRFLHKMAEQNLTIATEQAELEQPGFAHRRCTADALVAEGSLGDVFAVLECKSNASSDAGTDWTNEMPEHVLAQITWNMGVAGLEHGYVVVMHFGRTIEVIPVELDRDLLNLLREVADTFWTNHVLTGIAPPTDASDATADALRDAYPESTADAVHIATHDVIELHAAQQDVKTAELRKKLVTNRIKAQMGEAGIACDEQGEIIATWKTGQTKGLDTKALERDHFELVNSYRTKAPQRRFLPKGDSDGD